MLVLGRKVGEGFVIDGRIVVTILEGRGADQVRLGIEAPADVSIVRAEVAARQAQQRAESEDQPDTAAEAAGD